MSNIQEIEAAMQKLTRADLERVREWLEDYLEDQQEFTDEFKVSIERGRRDIAEGHVRKRQP